MEKTTTERIGLFLKSPMGIRNYYKSTTPELACKYATMCVNVPRTDGFANIWNGSEFFLVSHDDFIGFIIDDTEEEQHETESVDENNNNSKGVVHVSFGYWDRNKRLCSVNKKSSSCDSRDPSLWVDTVINKTWFSTTTTTTTSTATTLSLNYF